MRVIPVLLLAVAAAFAQGTSAVKTSSRFAPAIESLASKLETKYTIPEVGAKYASALRANLAKGRYDQVNDPKVLAERLTADLRNVSPDGHLRVDAVDDSAGPIGAPPEHGKPGEVPEW